MTSEKAEGMLSPYRVLDLADEKGILCGKLLGDLGADVIKIERPGGDLARNLGPFYHDEPDPENSLFWFAFNTSKRGITLDINTVSGQGIFKRLVKSADFVIESFSPGHLERLGLGYSALEKVNPKIIMVSITPFGQTGPYKDYKASDIVAWAMGGSMYPFGNADRPPVRISHHSQAYLHASSEAAAGAMLALYYRQITGEGQQVDVSVQESVFHAVDQETNIGRWDANKTIRRRGGEHWIRPDLNVIRIWPCQDGYIAWSYWFGLSAHWTQPLLDWMEEKGMLNDFLKGFDWAGFDWETATQEVLDRIYEPTRQFFMAHTKTELYEGALKRNVQLYPVSTPADMLRDVQLTGRSYWVDLEHPELGTTITYPGAFAQVSEVPVRVSRRAPLVGEHNQEIYEMELGISKEELLVLNQVRVI